MDTKIDLYARLASLSAMHVLWAYGQGQEVQKLSSVLDSSGAGESFESVSITAGFARFAFSGNAKRLAGAACATWRLLLASPARSPRIGQHILAC
jgi:hypothetical protein